MANVERLDEQGPLDHHFEHGIQPLLGPPQILLKLQQKCAKAVKSTEVMAQNAAESAIPGGGPSSEYGAFIAREQARWKEVVIKPQIRPG